VKLYPKKISWFSYISQLIYSFQLQMNRFSIVLVIIGIFLLLDFYVFQSIKLLAPTQNLTARKFIFGLYWFYTFFSVGVLLLFASGLLEKTSSFLRNFLLFTVFANLIFKLLMTIFLLLEDIARVLKLAYDSTIPEKKYINAPKQGLELINRNEFLSKTALAVATTPVVALTYGIISGAYDYRVRHIKLSLPNLPKKFNGIKIGQLSDIHSGSFYNSKAVKGGVEMLLNEKPDLIFFTGDLVNNTADETTDYIPIFRHLKAPLGVYSILGNHDYGDYMNWPSLKAKQKNFENIIQVHNQLGWRLLMNEHAFIENGGEKLAIIGIENFGAKGRFPKYGKLDLAYSGTEEAAVKLLLSHDPSHWDYQVRPQFPDIDLMFAGHTHGMQFGVDNKYMKWSPVQYMYKQWAGLYTEGKQHLYVNRGFGFIGYPGRLGILPEITIMELISA